MNLVTGFGPFGQIQENPSSLLAAACACPHRILEVSFEAVDAFVAELAQNPPENLLLLGVHGATRSMSLEIFGRNQIGPHPDVRGVMRPGRIEPSGPMTLSSTLWPRGLSAAVGEPNIVFSRSAGSYLCNYTLYRCLRALPSSKVGFLHVPTQEAMPLDEQHRLLARLIAVLGLD